MTSPRECRSRPYPLFNSDDSATSLPAASSSGDVILGRLGLCGRRYQIMSRATENPSFNARIRGVIAKTVLSSKLLLYAIPRNRFC